MAKTSSIKIVETKEAHKRKRWNKNTKKAHRKRIDISDVESVLEQKRREERHGGLIDERKSEDLLFLDTTGKESGQTFDDGTELPLGSDLTEKTELVGFKPSKRSLPKALKCHALLKGLPGCKDPLKKRNRVRTIEERRDPAVRKRLQSQAKVAAVKKAEILKVKDRIVEDKKKAARPKTNRQKDYGFDLWAPNDDGEDVILSYVRDIEAYHGTQTRTKVPIIPKGRYLKPSALPGLPKPDPGMSYNPSFDDHQALLTRAVVREERRLAKEEKAERKYSRNFPTKAEAPTAQTWLVEMSEGLPNQYGEEDEEEETKVDEDMQEDVTVSGKPLNERKTKLQRRKEMEQKQMAIEREKERVKKIRENKVFNIKTYQKEIIARDKKIEEMRQKRIKLKGEEKFKTKRLSKLKFEESDLAVALGDELPDSLRNLKPQVSLMEEQFRSFQRRNLIETRLRAKFERKYRRKLQVKRSYRVKYEDLRKFSV